MDAKWAGLVLHPRLQGALLQPSAAALSLQARLAAGGPAAAVRVARIWAQRALSGSLRSGLRALALAAPRLLPSFARGGAPGPVLGRVLPAALGLEIFGSALLALAVPRTCALGSQWVLSHDGLRQADRPLALYPRRPQSLGLRELGGLFPGHRMISYRNRIAHLAAATAGAAAAAR
jgi:hypothetical protein